MKVVIMFCVFMVMVLVGFAQRQTKYDSRTLVQFGKTYISITNNFITDSGRKYIPSTIQFPFKEETFEITGPQLNMSIASLDTGEFFKGGISGWLKDTIPEHQQLFSLPNLEVRVSRNQQVVVQWKDAVTFPVLFIDQSVIETRMNKPNYSLVNDTLQVNDRLMVELRSKQKPDDVFRMCFIRVALPVMPFSAMMMQDSSTSTSETEFIKRAVETGNEEFKSINSFYKDWPPKYGMGNNIQQYFPSSKLAFYFRRYNDTYTDSSLEYALITNDNKDSSWHSSGHLVIVTKLESNHHYTLLVRYKESRKNIWLTHFYVAPLWYQNSLFFTAAGIIGSLTSAFIVFFTISRRNLKRERQKREKLQLEQRAVRAQLNPHFTFNALSSIQSLMNQNKIVEANYYFTEFSSLLRNSLYNNEKEMLPLKEELQTLERYIKLEQLRFQFTYEIMIAKDINTSTVDVPSLLLQPLIENAIKHGISFLQEKGNVVISATKEEEDLKIFISDNGNGFNTKKESYGYGLALTEERIRLLNNNFKEQKIQIEINSNTSGTTVILSFLNWLQS